MKIILLPILSSNLYVSPVVLVWSWLFLSSLLSIQAVVHALEFETTTTFADLANTCVFTHNRRSVICQEVNALGVAIKYTVPCPSSATQAQDCLVDRRRICYQQNNVPCLGTYYCFDTKRFSIDCSNIFSKASGSTCSATDCFGNCIALVDTVKPYTQQGRDNACTGLDSDYTVSCLPGTNIINNDNCEASFTWTNVLGDGTEVVMVVKKGPQEFAYRSCDVRTSAGDQCQCAIACSNSNFISYDCSRFSTDLCAAINCQGLCINNNRMTGPQSTPPVLSGVARPPPTTPPVPPTRAPMAPPMTVPVPISNFWAVATFAPVITPHTPVPIMAPAALTFGNSPTSPVVPTPPVGFGPSPWIVRTPSIPNGVVNSPVASPDPAQQVAPFVPFTPPSSPISVNNPPRLTSFPVNSNPSWIVRTPDVTWSDAFPNPTAARPSPTSAPPRAISNTVPTAPSRPFSSTSQPSSAVTFDAAGAMDSQMMDNSNNINSLVPAPIPVIGNNPVSVATALPAVVINPALPGVEVINPVLAAPVPRPAEAPVPTRSGVVVSFTVQPAFRGPTTFPPAVSRFADAIESAAWNPVLSLLTTMVAALSCLWS